MTLADMATRIERQRKELAALEEAAEGLRLETGHRAFVRVKLDEARSALSAIELTLCVEIDAKLKRRKAKRKR